jgi:hypothetical protein
MQGREPWDKHPQSYFSTLEPIKINGSRKRVFFGLRMVTTDKNAFNIKNRYSSYTTGSIPANSMHFYHHGLLHPHFLKYLIPFTFVLK